jgi:predicted MFS family arabinose efflux permease
MLNAFGVAGAFRVYAGLCVGAFVFLWRYLPETKGRTLEEISQTWKRAR